MHPYIAIEGVIGVGKTTLASRLQTEYNATLLLEIFEENPFLAPFYTDPERYAFPVQVRFLLSRYYQQRRLDDLVGRVPVVSDYLFAKDRLFAQMNLKADEWATYELLYLTLAPHIPAPTLTIYLRASVDTLMHRIAQRGRDYEKNMARSYIAELADNYEHYFTTFDATPLLTIDTDDLDIISDPAAESHLFARIRDALMVNV